MYLCGKILGVTSGTKRCKPPRIDDIKMKIDKKKQDIAYFVSFCIEQYKNAKGLTGAEAANVLDHYGVLEYLIEHYDTLHTQSHQWILEDIDEFIHIRENEECQ